MFASTLNEMPDCPPGTEGYASPIPSPGHSKNDQESSKEINLEEINSVIEVVIKDKDNLVERFLNIHSVDFQDGIKRPILAAIKKHHIVNILCYVCGLSFKRNDLQNHLGAKKHRENVNAKKVWSLNLFEDHPFMKSDDKNKSKPPIAKSNEQCKLLEKLRDYTQSPVVGVEYVVELDSEKSTLAYYCVLCESKGMSQTIINHIVGRQHIVKYLLTHFPMAYRKLEQYINQKALREGVRVTIRNLCQKIEQTYGRLNPTLVAEELFGHNKKQVSQQIRDGKHFSQKDGPTFVELIDEKYIQAVSENQQIDIPTPDKTIIENIQSALTGPSGDSGIPANRWENVDLRNTLTKSKPEDGHPFKTDRKICVSPSDPNMKIVMKKSPRNSPSRRSKSPRFTKYYRETQMSGSRRSRSRDRGRSPGVRDRYLERQRDRERLASLRLSPRRRSRSPGFRSRGPELINGRERSPLRRERSPLRRERSPLRRERSPLRRGHSPVRRGHSPGRRGLSPSPRSHSPGRRGRSPHFKDHPLEGRSIIPRRVSPFPRRRSPSPQSRKNPYKLDNRLKNQQEKQVQLPKIDIKTKNKISVYSQRLEELEQTYNKITDFYEKNPEKHPQYQDEWKQYWNTKFKELKTENKDPTNYDYIPEWIVYWKVKMRKLINKEKDSRRDQLRTRSGLENIPMEELELLLNPDSQKETSENPPKEEELILSSEEFDVEYDKFLHTALKSSSNKKEKIQELTSEKVIVIGDSPPRELSDKPMRSVSTERSKNSLERGKKSPERSRRSSDRSKRSEHGEKSSRKRSRSRSREKKHKQSRRRRSKDRDEKRKRRSRSNSEDKQTDELNVISLLRLTTALENYLGSLGPKVIDMLALGLKMEKEIPNSSETILQMEGYAVLLETVKEKLKGQLQARLIDDRAINSTKSVVTNIAKLLHKAASYAQTQKTLMEKKNMNRITVDGIGDLEKATIASQIATALIAQGRTNVTTEELERLIHAVVGKANESNVKNAPMATAGFLETLTLQEKNSLFNKELNNESSTSGLGLLQAAYTDRQGNQQDNESSAIDTLSDSDLQTLLQNFKDLSEEEQHGLVKYLKKIENTDPMRVAKFRQFIVIPESDERNTREVSPFESRESTNFSMSNKPPVDKFVKVSDDEEDYTYDEVVKSVQEKEMQEKMELIQKSLQASDGNKNPPNTQDIISNLMVSLQQQNTSTSRTTPKTNIGNSDQQSFTNILNTIRQSMMTPANSSPLLNQNAGAFNQNYQNFNQSSAQASQLIQSTQLAQAPQPNQPMQGIKDPRLARANQDPRLQFSQPNQGPRPFQSSQPNQGARPLQVGQQNRGPRPQGQQNQGPRPFQPSQSYQGAQPVQTPLLQTPYPIQNFMGQNNNPNQMPNQFQNPQTGQGSRPQQKHPNDLPSLMSLNVDKNVMQGNKNNADANQFNKPKPNVGAEGQNFGNQPGFNKQPGFNQTRGGFTQSRGGFSQSQSGFNQPQGGSNQTQGAFNQYYTGFNLPQAGFNQQLEYSQQFGYDQTGNWNNNFSQPNWSNNQPGNNVPGNTTPKRGGGNNNPRGGMNSTRGSPGAGIGRGGANNSRGRGNFNPNPRRGAFN